MSAGAADADVERLLLSEPAYGGKFYVCPRALRPPAPAPSGAVATWGGEDDRRGVQEGKRYGVPKTPLPQVRTR